MNKHSESRFSLTQDALASVLDEIKHMLETFRAAVVGVRHFLLVMLSAEFAKQPHFISKLLTTIQGEDVALVLTIHGKDKIIMREIYRLDLACWMVEYVASSLACTAHAIIR